MERQYLPRGLVMWDALRANPDMGQAYIPIPILPYIATTCASDTLI